MYDIKTLLAQSIISFITSECCHTPSTQKSAQKTHNPHHVTTYQSIFISSTTLLNYDDPPASLGSRSVGLPWWIIVPRLMRFADSTENTPEGRSESQKASWNNQLSLAAPRLTVGVQRPQSGLEVRWSGQWICRWISIYFIARKVFIALELSNL